jgi:hypothetical protein
MARKLALKRLRPSDLSFFSAHLKSGLTRGKQKGFNLDKSVVEGEFFPSLTSVLITRPKKAIHLDLLLFGPGSGPVETLSRKIKIDAKNFRLNGEVINNPADSPARYDILQANDFALIEFAGEAEPTAVKVLLISGATAADRQLHHSLVEFFPRGSMRPLSTDELTALVASAAPADDHPIYQWSGPSELEDIAGGGARSIEQLNLRSRGRGLTQDELQDAKAAAELTGQRGEALVNRLLSASGLADVESFEWTASENAIAPYDFRVVRSGITRHVDVKSTSGDFANPVHLSYAELRTACLQRVPYDLYRVFELNGDRPRMRIAENVGPQLLPVLQVLESLPKGIVPDSVSVAPEFLQFGPGEYELDSLDAADSREEG